MAKRQACLLNSWQSSSKKQLVSQDKNENSVEDHVDDLNSPTDNGNTSDSDFSYDNNYVVKPCGAP